MANTFNVVITATDKATGTLKNINDEFAKLTKPFNQVGASFKRFGQELGLDKVGKSVAKVGQHARETAGKIGSMLSPLAAITSVASVAGITAMADSWAKFGRSVTYGAQAIAVGAPTFQKLQQLGQLSGVGADAVTSSLENLGTVMQDARFGRNQPALMMFNRLGIGIKTTKDGVPDVVAQMHAVAKVMTRPEFKNNPFLQSLIANTAGLGAMLPVLRQGEQGLKKYEEMQTRLGYTSSDEQIAQADKFALSIEGLKLAASGLGQSIMDEVMPAIRPFIDELSDWIAKNRALISQKVAEWAKGVAQWIASIDWKKVGDSITKFIDDIGKVVDAFGGWKNAIIGVVAIMNAQLIASVVQLGLALGGPLLRVLGSVIGKFWEWGKAAQAATAATEAATAAGEAGAAAGGVTAGAVAGGALAVGAAGLAGYGVGTYISKNYVEGTSFGDKLGSALVHGAAALGVKSAQESVTRMDQAEMREKAQKRAQANPRNTAKAMAYFQSQGWTKEQAAGLTANLLEESGLNQTVYGDSGAAYGIGQWHKDRQAEFAKKFGHPIQGSTLDEQLAFVQYELTQGNERKAGGLLKASRGAGMAGDTISRWYERPAATEEAAANRAMLAQQVAAQYGAAPTAAATAAAPGAAPTGPAAAGKAPTGPMVGAPGAPGAAGKITVEFQNAPPGTKARVQPSTGDVSVAPRIGTTAVGAGA